MPAFNPIPPDLTPQEIERFWFYVDKTPGQGPKGECHEWRGGRVTKGYGVFGIAHKRQYVTSRLVLFFTTGEWPPIVMHSCDWPPCCRPEHVSAGTQAKNLADAAEKGRMAKGERHGSKVHPDRVARGVRHGTKTKPQRIARGENAGPSKLKNADVLAIRARHANGERLIDIARDYPVNANNIGMIVKRITFRHI